MNTTSAPVRKPGYFDFKRAIRDASLKRQLKVILVALMGLCPAGELTTERFPVTIDKVMTETHYSRSYVIRLIGELEDLGYIEKRRSIYRDAQGHIRNRPNVYTLRLPDVEQKPPHTASSPRSRPVTPPPTSEPVYADLSADEEAELSAAYEAHLQALAEADVSRDEDIDRAPVEPPAPPAPPAPDPTPEPQPEQASKPEAAPLVAESPDGFFYEEKEMGDAIMYRAKEKLQPFLNKPKAHPQVVVAWSTILAARYTIGRFAIDACAEHKIKEKEILACVDEWIRKCVLRFDGLTRHELALRLRRFFHDKGRAIVKMRNSEKFGLQMLA